MRFLFLIALLTLATGLPATPTSPPELALTGTVVTEGDVPLEYATVSVYAPDSTLVEGTVTNAAGEFTLSLDRGRYRLRLEFIGFAARDLSVELTGSTDLGRLPLAAADLTLDEVEVRATRSRVNLQLDKKIFNVGEDALAQAGSAGELLTQVPSVTVSAEGVVSLRGNPSVRILINGRPSALADNNALESIPAASIERVEVITNPSARYEAAGTAGIINIVLRQERERGYGGTVTLTTGYPADHQALLNLNYRDRKFSAFANLGLRYSNYRGGGRMTRTSTLEGTTTTLVRIPAMQRNDRARNGYAGFDYRLDGNTTLTAAYSIYDMVNDDVLRDDYSYTDGQNRPLRDLLQTQDYLEPGTYHQVDVILARTFGEDRKLTLQFNHDAWDELETEAIRIAETAPLAGELVSYRTQTDEGSKDFRLQADYEAPLGERGGLEAGLRAESRIISADYRAEQAAGADWVPLADFINTFDYYERIGSGYVQYAYRGPKFGFQLGLRGEYTGIETENRTEPTEDLRKGYPRLFPSASAKYDLAEGVSTQLSYSRRIRRPAFWQLNPFSGLRQPTNLFFGNPDLDPAFTDRLELNLLVTRDRLTLNPALYASRTVDYFFNVLEQRPGNRFGLDDGTIVGQPVNLDRQLNYGTEINLSYRPTEVVTLSGDVHLYGYRQRGDLAGRSFDFDFVTLTSSLRAQANLSGGLSLQGSLAYQAPREDAQSRNLPSYFGTLGISQRWKENYTLTLSLRSPRYFRELTYRPSFQQDDYFEWTGWRFGASARYRFERGAGADGRRQRGSIR